MPDDKKKDGGGAVGNSHERWRGEMTADQKTIKGKLDALLLRIDMMIQECSKRHCGIEHRLTTVEQNGKSLTGRMAGLTKILIGAVILIVGASAAAVLLR